LNDLRIKSEVWMNGNLGNRSYKRIANYDSPIGLNQYRVVLRFWFHDVDGDGVAELAYDPEFIDVLSGEEYWNFHWWYQTRDGTWADKDGISASRLIPGVTDP